MEVMGHSTSYGRCAVSMSSIRPSPTEGDQQILRASFPFILRAGKIAKRQGQLKVGGPVTGLRLGGKNHAVKRTGCDNIYFKGRQKGTVDTITVTGIKQQLLTP